MISLQNQFKVSSGQRWSTGLSSAFIGYGTCETVDTTVCMKHHAEAVKLPVGDLQDSFSFHTAHRRADHIVCDAVCLCVPCPSDALHLEWFCLTDLMFDVHTLHNPLHADHSASSYCTGLKICILWSVVENSTGNVAFLIKLYVALPPGPPCHGMNLRPEPGPN